VAQSAEQVVCPCAVTPGTGTMFISGACHCLFFATSDTVISRTGIEVTESFIVHPRKSLKNEEITLDLIVRYRNPVCNPTNVMENTNYKYVENVNSRLRSDFQGSSPAVPLLR
jgi:hypothetical protein